MSLLKEIFQKTFIKKIKKADTYSMNLLELPEEALVRLQHYSRLLEEESRKLESELSEKKYRRIKRKLNSTSEIDTQTEGEVQNFFHNEMDRILDELEILRRSRQKLEKTLQVH